MALHDSQYNSQYKSQWQQDRVLNETIFNSKKGGVFVDVGAHDGVSCSNTYFFEKELGWTGLCIEPLEDRYKELLLNRPKSTCIYGCAYDSSGTIDFREVRGYSEMLSGVEPDYHPAHVQRIEREINQQGGTSIVVKKPAYTLSQLFEEHKLTQVDYLSIDTEGCELKVLQGIDFNKVNISVIDVENNYGSDDVKLFLESKGYLRIMKIVGDDIYVKDV